MADQIWTVKAILDWCEGYLERKGDAQPRLSAQWLLSEVTGLSRIELYTNLDRPLSPEERDIMRAWVTRRGQGEPLQLISGKAPFRYLTIEVGPGVLIPRPETEVLVSEALKELNLPRTTQSVQWETVESLSNDDDLSETTTVSVRECIVEPEVPAVQVLDLCTGSGCVACAIASEYPAAHVIASDISEEALALAKRNVESLGLSDRVTVVKSDLMEAFRAQKTNFFDAIVSNPPYIPTAVLDTLDREVMDFEPVLALDGGVDGLDLYRLFIGDAFFCLKPNGVLAVELHEDCLESAANIAREAGFDRVRIVKDLAGRDRDLVAHKPV